MQSRSFLATATSLSVVPLAAFVAVFLASSATPAETISAGDSGSIPYITPGTSNDASITVWDKALLGPPGNQQFNYANG